MLNSIPRPKRSWPAADPYSKVGAAESHGWDDYQVLRDVLAGTREAPVTALNAAGLRGMGGAGFPTARKWSLVAAEPASPKYVICNADESEPGTFKDRELLHDLPHLVIEGMAIGAYCSSLRKSVMDMFMSLRFPAARIATQSCIQSRRSMISPVRVKWFVKWRRRRSLEIWGSRPRVWRSGSVGECRRS